MAVVIAAATWCARGEARAQGVPPAYGLPGAHTHDGFFLRLTPGLGGAASSESVDGLPLTLSGGGISGSVAVGGAISPSVVLCAETTAISAVDPTVEYRGDRVELTGGAYAVQYLGLAASYYFASNAYLHAGIGGMWVGVETPDGASMTTDAGLAVKGAGGREWWVSDNWGLGVAGSILLGSVRDGDVDMPTALVSVELSATYN